MLGRGHLVGSSLQEGSPGDENRAAPEGTESDAGRQGGSGKRKTGGGQAAP